MVERKKLAKDPKGKKREKRKKVKKSPNKLIENRRDSRINPYGGSSLLLCLILYSFVYLSLFKSGMSFELKSLVELEIIWSRVGALH